MSRFSKLVKKRFMDRFRETLPDCRKQDLGKNEHAWTWSLSNGTAYIVLEILPPKRTFSIDLSWQRAEDSGVPSGLGAEPWEPERGVQPYRFNLGKLWQGDAVSWTVPDAHISDAMIGMLKELADNRRFVFTRDDADKWIADNPGLYHGQVIDEEERLVYPVVDHAVDRVVRFAVPYFRRLSAAD
jgi:hypothetical protein